MNSDLQLVAQQQAYLGQVTDVGGSRAVEGFAAAGQAWAKEHKVYDKYVEYAHLYILARRKTVELVLPLIKHGGHNKQPDEDVQLLEDFGFTWKQ